MKHADELIERILFLEGVPNMQRLDKVRVGETVREQLTLDLKLEEAAVARFNKAIALAVEMGDNTTRELLAGHAQVGGGARRLARVAARADRAGRRAELPGAADPRVTGCTRAALTGPRRPIGAGSSLPR